MLLSKIIDYELSPVTCLCHTQVTKLKSVHALLHQFATSYDLNYLTAVCVYTYIYNILNYVKQPAYKKVQGQTEAIMVRGYKRPKTLISSKARKLTISLKILLLE